MGAVQREPTSPADITPSLLNPTSHTLVRCPHPVHRSLDLRSTFSHPLVDTRAGSPIPTLWLLSVVISQVPSQPLEMKSQVQLCVTLEGRERLPSCSSTTFQTRTVRSSEAEAMRFPSSRQDILPWHQGGNTKKSRNMIAKWRAESHDRIKSYGLNCPLEYARYVTADAWEHPWSYVSYFVCSTSRVTLDREGYDYLRFFCGLKTAWF